MDSVESTAAEAEGATAVEGEAALEATVAAAGMGSGGCEGFVKDWVMGIRYASIGTPLPDRALDGRGVVRGANEARGRAAVLGVARLCFHASSRDMSLSSPPSVAVTVAEAPPRRGAPAGVRSGGGATAVEKARAALAELPTTTSRT